ncbi:hypothetical protein SDC9_92171 [bioreactor metagenome]|uniref:Uncharacterized protein n=1 Tax=bioreactor metagenome TaxID=1076179 RepID=A0A645A6V1_9ZZZZ
MSKFTCKAIVAVHHLSVHHNPTSYTGSESDYNKVFHSAGCPVCHFTDGCRIGIVGKRHGNTYSVFQHLCKRNNSFPTKVGSKFDTSGEIVAVGCSGSNSFDLIFGGNILDHIFNHLAQFIQVVFHFSMLSRFQTSAT